MKQRKLKRYHREIFFPEWAEGGLEIFVSTILKKGSLTFSLHAMDKSVDYCVTYGKNLFLETLKKIPLEFKNIFEFRSVGEEIRKACFRYSLEELPVDIVLVISSDGVVITIYLINKGDNHATLNKKLYERKS